MLARMCAHTHNPCKGVQESITDFKAWHHLHKDKHPGFYTRKRWKILLDKKVRVVSNKDGAVLDRRKDSSSSSLGCQQGRAFKPLHKAWRGHKRKSYKPKSQASDRTLPQWTDWVDVKKASCFASKLDRLLAFGRQDAITQAVGFCVRWSLTHTGFSWTKWTPGTAVRGRLLHKQSGEGKIAGSPREEREGSREAGCAGRSVGHTSALLGCCGSGSGSQLITEDGLATRRELRIFWDTNEAEASGRSLENDIL